MRLILHIVTRPGDALAAEVVTRQQQQTELAIRMIDLTKSQPDYDQLLNQIFEADSVQVW
jgi:hypothetical protein